MNKNMEKKVLLEKWYIVGSEELKEYMRKNKCFDQSFDKEDIGYYRNMDYWDCFILDEKSSGAVEISLQDYLRYIGESSTENRNTKLQEKLESFNTDLDKIIDGVHPFEKITKEMFELYKRKNKDYGDSFSKGFSEYGIIMPCIRLEDKFLRFKQLAKGFKPEVQDEKIEDTLVDMANYAIMTLIELKNKSNEDK